MQCPNCHVVDRDRILRGPRNICRGIVNFLNSFFWLGFWPFVSIRKASEPVKPLTRQCLECGFLFEGPTSKTPDYDECANCGYRLIGNLSGRCPECGWTLPRRFRAYRRLCDRKLPNHPSSA